jgi:hypothetical protein
VAGCAVVCDQTARDASAGDIAVVTGRLQGTRSVNGRAAPEDWRFRKVYRRAASGWRVISYHAWVVPR